MIFQYKNTAKVTEMLNDLIKIHNDRIAGYLYALNQSSKIDSGLCEVFEKIIIDSSKYKDELFLAIKELNGSSLKGASILGKIYRAWAALKVTFSENTQKVIIATCLFNEEIALHTYNVALNSNLPIDKNIIRIIEKQKNELKEVHSAISSFREPVINIFRESHNRIALNMPQLA